MMTPGDAGILAARTEARDFAKIDEALDKATDAGIAAARAQFERDGRQDCGSCGGAMLSLDARSLLAKRAIARKIAWRSDRGAYVTLQLPDGVRTQNMEVYIAQMNAFRVSLVDQGFADAVRKYWTYVD